MQEHLNYSHPEILRNKIPGKGTETMQEHLNYSNPEILRNKIPGKGTETTNSFLLKTTSL